MQKAYKIQTVRNLADTWRDPDEIVYKNLGYTFSLEKAISIVEKYIEGRKAWSKCESSNPKKYVWIEVCSWGRILTIEEIEII